MSEHETPALDGLVIGILGGTGPQGRGLARRFAMAGHPVIIGSRNHDRALGVASADARVPPPGTGYQRHRTGVRGLRDRVARLLDAVSGPAG